MDENKTAFLSGRLNGTKTLETELNSIQNPDMYEKFLIEFLNLKLKFGINNEIIYLNDKDVLDERFKSIDESTHVSIFIDEKFNKICITTNDKKTYIIKINKTNITFISNLISRERPVKFLLNSFSFIKWCSEKRIEVKNVFDILSYIKILTNNVDIESNMENYIEKYTNKKLDQNDDNINKVIIGNYILEFGKYLEKYINQFNLINICKLINENAYYESLKTKKETECEIVFSYYELKTLMDEYVKKIVSQYKDKCYVLSPLGKIALKFGRDEKD